MGGSGSGYGKRKGAMTEEELKRKHKKEDSDAYLFDVEYEKLKKEREEAEKEYAKARDEYIRISKELREEMANGTVTDSEMARFMAVLSDRGVQLQEEQVKAQEQIDKMAEVQADVENRMNELRMKAFGGNTRAWNSADRTADYRGFKIDSQDRRYANAKIVEMTPEEYLRRVAFDVKGKGIDDVLNNVSPSVVEKYMRQMLRGVRFGSPSLNYRNGSISKGGSERALAAMLNGYGRIPVMVIE